VRRHPRRASSRQAPRGEHEREKIALVEGMGDGVR
jgi:hypothetical protein